jgi:dienelactone hydrolase
MTRKSLGFSAFLVLSLLSFGWAAENSETAAAHLAVPKSGTVFFRPTKSEPSVPQLFHLKSHRFPFEAEYTRTSGPARIYKVRFPSPVVTSLKVNNTVHGHYFQPPGKGPFPGVVVLHILGGDFPLSQMVANGLARRNVAALFIKLPYYGERRGDSRERFISFEPDVTQRNFTQAVLDIRRAAAWLGSRPEVDENQLGVTGISLGGIISALAAPAEPRFAKVAIYLGGGNLGEMVWQHDNAAAVAFRKSWLSRGETQESFIKKTRPVDPATYGHLLKDRTVLMVAAKHDTIVPRAATMALWNSIGRKPKLVWLDAGHISAAQFLYGEMERLGTFFQPTNK